VQPHETLPRDVPQGWHDNAGTVFFVGEGQGKHPPQQFDRAKTSKFGAILDNFRLWPGISLELMEVSTTDVKNIF